MKKQIKYHKYEYSSLKEKMGYFLLFLAFATIYMLVSFHNYYYYTDSIYHDIMDIGIVVIFFLLFTSGMFLIATYDKLIFALYECSYFDGEHMSRFEYRPKLGIINRLKGKKRADPKAFETFDKAEKYIESLEK